MDIQKPDFELRKKIVEKKSEELNSLYVDQVNISKELGVKDLKLFIESKVNAKYN